MMSGRLIHRQIPIRALKIVICLDDPFQLPLLYDEYVKLFGSTLSSKTRIVEIEVLTCPEDAQPITTTECGKCRKFIRRSNNHILCRSLLTPY